MAKRAQEQQKKEEEERRRQADLAKQKAFEEQKEQQRLKAEAEQKKAEAARIKAMAFLGYACANCCLLIGLLPHSHSHSIRFTTAKWHRSNLRAIHPSIHPCLVWFVV